MSMSGHPSRRRRFARTCEFDLLCFCEMTTVAPLLNWRNEGFERYLVALYDKEAADT